MSWSWLYRAVFVERWSWPVAGLAVGLLVPALYYFFNRPLGVSTGYLEIVSRLARPPGGEVRPGARSGPGWRLFFLAGMACGGALSRLASASAPVFRFARFTGLEGVPGWFTAAHLLLGGLLLGYGSRLADGCTSGHGIHGVSQLHGRSVLATAFFLLFAFLSNFLLRLFLPGDAG